MKTYIKIFWLILAISPFVIGCYDDEGNYDYQTINEISIGDTLFIDTIYTVYSGLDTLRITPTIESTLSENESNYKYEWIIKSSTFGSTIQQIIPIDTTRNLVYPVSLKTGMYSLFFRITDRTTGLRSVQTVIINVRDHFSSGWLLLGEDQEGYVQVDMLSISDQDTLILRNVCENTGLPKIKNPTIIYTINYFKNFGIYLGTKSESYVLRAKNLETANSEMPADEANFPRQGFAGPLRWQFFYPEKTGPCELQDMVSLMNNIRSVVVNGNLHDMNLYASKPKFGNVLNHYRTNYNRFNFGLKLGYSLVERSKTIVLYNTDEGRFVQYNPNITKGFCDSLQNNPTDPTNNVFSWKPKLEFVTTINSHYSNGFTFTVLKDPTTAQYYIYSYRISSSFGVLKQQQYEIKNAPELAKATIFGFSANLSYMFYYVGSKIYAYDYFSKRSQMIKDFGGDEITMCYYDIRSETKEDVFYVATYNLNTQGTLMKFKVIDDPNQILVEEVKYAKWENLCRIKSMDYKIY